MINDYKIIQKLGEGSYGVIYKVKKENENKYYALKQIKLSANELENNALKKEAEILSKINSKYVIKYYECFEKDNNLNIIMEYCDGGDLSKYIEKQKKLKLSENTIWKIFIKITIGLADIHKINILHRDLKPLNIFLKKDMDIRIGDFGISKILQNTYYARTFIGTAYYLSPEICEDKPYNNRTDVWSLGCILYELCTYNHPFDGNSIPSIILKIMGESPKEIENYSNHLKNLLKILLNKDYQRRPSSLDILKMEFIKNKAEELGIIDDIKNSFPYIYAVKNNEDFNHLIKSINKNNNETNIKNKKNEITVNKKGIKTERKTFGNDKNESKFNNINKNNNIKKGINTNKSTKNIKKKESNDIQNIIIKTNKKIFKNNNDKIFDKNKNEFKNNNKIIKNINNNNNDNSIKKITLLPCKERFSNKEDKRNKIKEEDIFNKKNENIQLIKLLPCKEKRKKYYINNIPNNKIDSIKIQDMNKLNQSQINTINQKNNYNDNNTLISKKTFINDFSNEERNNNKIYYKNNNGLKISITYDLEELIEDFDSSDIEKEKKYLKKELENSKVKIDNLKKDIILLIGEDKFKEIEKIISIGIKDNTKSEEINTKIEIFIKDNFPENMDKEKMYNIFRFFILQTQYYKKQQDLNKL